MRLDQTTVDALPASINRPRYDRSRLRTGIVHLGVGAFHRSHQAMFLDRLMTVGRDLDWAICGVGTQPDDARMRDVLAEQDNLYTLVVKHPDGTRESRVIGSINEYLLAPDDPEAVVERMTDPAVRIVSLTITEGGYNIDRTTGEFDTGNPDVVADIAAPSAPTTVFGLVVEALIRRRDRGIAPFAVMSCDNLQGNGHVARRSFTSFARLRDGELASWIETDVRFPNSMVDRITPATTSEDVAHVAADLGVADRWPVTCEPFAQWVLEDDFSLGRPSYEDVGVQVVADVEPYELMKLRLLNATHQGMCYFGSLLGYRYVHEAAADDMVANLLLDYMDIEATPTLAPVPGVDLDRYKLRLIERYRNPHIKDTLARLCADASDRIPMWLLPVVRERLAAGGSVTRAAAIVASWARYAEGVDERGQPIDVVDRLSADLVPIARSQRAHPPAFIENRSVFGSLADDSRFANAYLEALSLLHTEGARATLLRLTLTEGSP